VTKVNVLEFIQKNITYLDGGMGSLLQKRGLVPGELPEWWNISHPDVIIEIQKAYFDAGSHIVCTNTFGANALKFSDAELETIIRAAVDNANTARKTSVGAQPKFVALDIGPIGKLLKPYGDLDFEDAVNIYAKTVRIGAACGVDLIFIETMSDSYDTKAALLAAKENCRLPVFVSNAYGEDGKLMTGATPAAMVAMLEGMGADAIGANCSLGPKQLAGVVQEYLEYASVPVLIKPNAGLPRSEDGKTVYDVTTDEFAHIMADYVANGVRIAGGCCGTTPEYIQAICKNTVGFAPIAIQPKNRTMISSYTHVVEFAESPILIGERINPTGKKRLKEALRTNDLNYILGEGIAQQEKGVHVLDVNVGLPEIDEAAVLPEVCFELQAIIDLPLQIDTVNSVAMEKALRRYNGKALVNSVSGREDVMAQIFPLVKKYGGLVVCLTLDENGIPTTADERVKIAEKIISRAMEYGIDKKDLIFDTLAMAVSADPGAARETLKALNIIKNRLGCHTSLGVSNVSFGLPNRDSITASFFTMALSNGLSAAIMNPNSAEIMKAYYSFNALTGLDAKCEDYIDNIGKYAADMPAVEIAYDSDLQRAIIKGLKEQAGTITEKLLETEDPLDIVSKQIIPALDIVGQGFEKNTMFLPQLLMSAEASQAAFEKIKQRMPVNVAAHKGKFVIATVQGDIHDIGKNIVKLILENYGFDVYDLGRDVPPERIVEEVVMQNAPLVGLSALMTTTVPAMEATIKLLRKEAPWAKIVVGGAVLTQEYADAIGADYYAKDAMATVRYSEQVVNA
jgi:5-methyltetrahydrofolate--homocysteine methyltransferase